MKKQVGNLLKKVGIMPSMKSPRLVYRKFNASDWEDYFTHISNPDVMKYIGDGALEEEAAKKKFQKVLETNAKRYAYGFFGVWTPEGKFVGLAKFDFIDKRKVEVGYALLPQYWGQGYASEMLEGMVHYGKQLHGIKELYGLIDPDNPGSRKVLERLGFALYERGYFDEKRTDYYRLII